MFKFEEKIIFCLVALQPPPLRHIKKISVFAVSFYQVLVDLGSPPGALGYLNYTEFIFTEKYL